MSMPAVWMVNWPPWLKILTSLAIITSWMFHLWRDALLQMSTSVVAVLLKSDGSIEVTRSNGTTITGQQMPGSFVHPWFTTILWRGEGMRLTRSVIVLLDSLPPDQFRELRVWLKWRRIKNEES
jgi:hypothetical protein